MGTQERAIFVAFSLVAVFLVMLLSFFFLSLFKQNRKYRRLQTEKLNAEINATEIERNLIATELHNDIGPYLSSIKMRLNLLEVKAALDKCVDQVRGMAKSLAPLAIFHIALIDALKQYIAQVSFDKALKIHLIEKELPVLNQDQSNQLYRILQEIILNTVKHAHATELNIEFSKVDNHLLIRTADNGIGYDTYAIRENHKMGLGLLGIQSRIEYLHGTMVASDEIEKGTRYNIRIPIVAKS